MVDVLLASDAEHAADLGGEAPLLRPALADAGLTAGVAVWDDPGVDWGSARLVVVRSVWDSHRRREEVLGWAAAVEASGADLRNPAAVLQRNTHKSYLRDLADAGVPVVPTLWPTPGPAPGLRTGPGATDPVGSGPVAWAAALGEDLVVKPAVSAGAERTVRTDPAGAARAVAELWRTGATPMVQPHLASAHDPGETKVVVLGGRVSHAVTTRPMLVPDPGSPDAHRGRDLAADEAALVEQVLAAVPERDELLYARVDLLRADDGAPLLAELELVEPFLFLAAHPEAPARLAQACAALL